MFAFIMIDGFIALFFMDDSIKLLDSQCNSELLMRKMLATNDKTCIFN